MQVALPPIEETHPAARASRLEGPACPSIDVEFNPDKDNRIFKLGAARSDCDATLDLDTDHGSKQHVAHRLNQFAQGADPMH